ncbi:MAG TPA: hypothetical protein VLJ20_08830 [Acetobacteraceae bacterium]|nr:hypothetical protein [Acetobacteraceae bacterium]
MDRNLVYPGSIPLDSDLLAVNRNAMVAIGALAQAVLGTGMVADGLACTPTSPASMSVTVAPGSIAQLSVVDTLAFGTLPADITDPLVKMGINLASTSFTLTAPTTSGQSVNYLIQAALQESDTGPVVLPYYNAANPTQPYSGPNNSGVAQNTQRIQRVQLQLKAGAPAPAGTQATPPIDNGWAGLYVITVGYGQTAVTGASISTLPTAPFLAWKLPSLRPGFASGVQSFGTSGSFTVPAGVTTVEVEVWGAGSGSYASTSTAPSGGGGGGGYARRRIAGLTPGQAIPVTIGAGGAAGTTTTGPGPGGTSSFGTFVSATGGGLNSLANISAPQNGAPAGQGVGGDINLFGSDGQTGTAGLGGMGGGAAGTGTRSVAGATGNTGYSPGGGAAGAGTLNGAQIGAWGASGFVIVRW